LTQHNKQRNKETKKKNREPKLYSQLPFQYPHQKSFYIHLSSAVHAIMCTTSQS
jgi:hypothetical protein